MKKNSIKVTFISVLAIALVSLAITLGIRQFSAQTIPSIHCPSKGLSKPHSLESLIKESPSIVKGDLILPANFPEVMLEPTPLDKVVFKIDERLKGNWPDAGKEIMLCPDSVVILHSQSPILVFLSGKDSKTSYWVPVQAYDTSFKDPSDESYDMYFANGKKTYSIDDIRKAIKEQK